MPAPAAMTVDYASLLERVGHFLFGIRSSFSADQTSDIEDCIEDGLHDVYTAHDWSFLRPITEVTTTAPYTTGTVAVASGVVTLSGGTFPSWAAVGVLKVSEEFYDVASRDSNTQVTLEDTSVTVAAGTTYELTRPEYDLPTGFEAVANDSNLTYEPGQADWYPPVCQRHDALIRQLQQENAETDRPRFYSIRTVEFDPTVGSRKRLSLYPIPDAAYVLKVPMVLRPTMIDSTNEYPLGGETLAQVILEACLAAAERNFDEQQSLHRQRFAELLPLAIAADLEKSTPTSLGPDSPTDETNYVSRSMRMGDVTLDGTVL